MRRGIRKHLVSFLLILTMCICLMPVNAQAAAPKKTDQGIRSICRAVDGWTYVYQYSTSGRKKTLRLNSKTKKSLTSIDIYFYHKKKVLYDETIDDGSYVRLNTKFFIRDYKNLFGKKITLNKNEKGKFYKVRNGKIYSAQGDTGAAGPAYRIQSIRSLGNGKYRIRIKDLDVYYEGAVVRGNSWITVKKSRKSEFGYVIQKIVVQYK